MKNIAIIGSGSFGCALANYLSNLGHNIKVWSYKQEECDAINEEHKCIFIPEVKLNENIKCYTNYEDVIKNSEYTLMVTPSSVVRSTIKDIKKYITNQKIVMCSKGLEETTNKLLKDVVNEEISNITGILSGPSIAREILQEKKTSVVFASESDDFNNEIKDVFESTNFTVELSNDVIGVEIGGALKNIGALAYGIIEGLNLGENIKATTITKILDEISKIGLAIGAKKDTFYGLSCLGDLIATCTSKESRNHKAGILLSKGKSIKEIKEEIGMVIEGLDSIKVAYDLSNKYNLDLQTINELYNLITKLS
ncbi:MAG: NAD(P)-dependent glycerol-3-phosphate dehydrogenase [Bacilli bacterium]|nr:NAD(P)-dependent glycerol-3-phosphate dehydrogenase [Bacilli bacterium]